MSNSTVAHSLKFESTLEDNDYGLILSQEGALKGIWVPDHLWNEPIPYPLVKICIENYGVDPNDPEINISPSSLH